MKANCYQMVFNDMGSELADPSAIATPLRPAEMFKVVDLEKPTIYVFTENLFSLELTFYQVGPLSLSHTVLDEILSEKKVSLCQDEMPV